MQAKAMVLCDNAVYGVGGIAEHGWAVWIETLSGILLFDTGQGRALLRNAHYFGKDLASVNAICISHHHFDHTGGLLGALQVMRGGRDGTCIPVYGHPDLFKESYSIPKGKKPRYIGIPFSRAAVEGAGAHLRLEFEWREIEDGVFLTGEVPRRTEFERDDPDLKHFGPQGELVTDPIIDDQALVIDTHQGLFIVLGCSHAGVINILTYIVERAGRSRIHTIIGGTHLGPAGDEQVTKTISALDAFDIERIGVTHCTGQKVVARMSEAFGERFFFCSVASEVEV
jgi:7,8-dihydropterin-6-yl-methyl-4-(beta-D-ribofuranosyl)aminobenzene 5'-phosphate synthase